MLGKGLESLMPSQNSGNGGNDPRKKAAPPPDLPIQEDGNFPMSQPQISEPPANQPPKKFEFHAPEPIHYDPPRRTLSSQEHFSAPEEQAKPQPVRQEPPKQEAKEEIKPETKPVEIQHQEPKRIEVEPVHLSPQKIIPKQEFKQEHLAEKKPERGDYIFYLEVNKIIPNRSQPRRHFSEDAIRELASSIREFGVLQPIVVTKRVVDTEHGTDVEYELIAGERRLKAVKLLGLLTIPAIVRNVDLERERLELAVIENLQRENLNVIEVARSYARLQDEFRMTQREVAAKLGKSRETVANTMRLLDLPLVIQEALETGKLSESHGRLLLAIDDPAAQQSLFMELLQKPMTTRELKGRVQVLAHKEKIEKSNLTPEFKMLQEKLSSELGAPVLIEQQGETGKITIRFYSPEELQQIVQKLGKPEEF